LLAWLIWVLVTEAVVYVFVHQPLEFSSIYMLREDFRRE
jgi:hypothetical protein